MLRRLQTKEQRIPLQHQLKPLSVAFVAAALGIATYSGMDVAMKGLALQVGAYNAMFWRSLITSFSPKFVLLAQAGVAITIGA